MYKSLPLREGGYFLTASGHCLVLTTQGLYPLPTTGLANLDNHKILTPTKAGVDLFGLSLARFCERLTIELQNFLASDWTIHSIGQTGLVWNGDSEKAHPSLTLGIFDDLKLGSHFRFPW